MGIDFLISHDDKTKIENLCDGSYVLYNRKQGVKDYIEEIIGSSIITGMTKSKEDNSKEVKFTTTTIIVDEEKTKINPNAKPEVIVRPGNIIRFKDGAIAEYTDIMSEMNNKRIADTHCKFDELVEKSVFDTVKIIIDAYRSDLDDSSFSIDDGVILYHLMQSKYNTIESRDQRILSDIIDRFISVNGVAALQQGVQNTDGIISAEGKTLISNEEIIKRMINRKVVNYGKRI